jgi:uncharacterized protein
MFQGDVLISPSTSRDYGEDRFIAIGVVEGRELAVVYTMRGDVCRIISVRRARENEREAYHAALLERHRSEPD